MSAAHVTAILSRDWQPAPPASEAEIRHLLDTLPFVPPDDYLDLLRLTNGGEGELALDPMWFLLYDAAFTAELWNHPHYRETFPNYFFFGSNGGLEAIAMMISESRPWSVVAIDCIAGPESAVTIANSFEEFLSKVGVCAI
jgi:hypothetical protein